MYQAEMDAFKTFITPLSSIVNITNEQDYENVLSFMDELFDVCQDEAGDPLAHL